MSGLRERTRRAVAAEVTEVALRLFAEQGFDETTVDDIARAAGMSKRSFFRYFAAKEDVVLGGVDLMSERIVAEIAARPSGEDPWSTLHAVLRGWAGHIDGEQRTLRSLRLIEGNAELRAGFHRKREEVRAEITRALAERNGLGPFEADLLTAAAGAALDCASRECARTEGPRLRLVDEAFDLLRPRT